MSTYHGLVQSPRAASRRTRLSPRAGLTKRYTLHILTSTSKYLYQHVRRHYYQLLRSLKLNIAYTALLYGSLTYGARVIHQRHPKPSCQSPIQGSRRVEPGLRRHLYVSEAKERHTPRTPSLCRAGHIHHPHKNPYCRLPTQGRQ